jgi:acyl-CoA thioesterase FadM
MSEDVSCLYGRREVVTERRPLFEGCNVGTWIGFKHVTYLAQEGALDWLRAHDLAPGKLFEASALATEVVGCRLRLLKGVRVDDVVTLSVTPATRPGDDRASFDVRLLRRDGGEKLAQGRFAVVWRTAGAALGPAAPPPADVLPFLAQEPPDRPPRPAEVADEAVAALRPGGKPSVVRSRRITYPLCCCTERIQFSAYVRLLEEMVEELLAERGISVGALLAERRWAPVVSRVEIEALRPAYMEEGLHAVFSIDEVLKDLVFPGRMTCYVRREGRLVEAARAAIDHAYVQFDTRAVGSAVVPLDARVKKALLGE